MIASWPKEKIGLSDYRSEEGDWGVVDTAHDIDPYGENVMSQTLHGEPIEFIGDEVLIDPALLEPNVPYPFQFGGTYVVLVKRDNGEIDFYSLEAE